MSRHSRTLETGMYLALLLAALRNEVLFLIRKRLVKR